MAKTDKPLTRDSLISMQVIDANGQLVGKVKDVAFEVGKSGVSLSVENEKGETKIVEWAEVQAASDFIILKPQRRNPNALRLKQQAASANKQPMAKQKTPPVCPLCGKPLTWIPQYKRYYCYNDKKYFTKNQSLFFYFMMIRLAVAFPIL